MNTTLSLKAYWPAHKMTAQEFIDAFKEFFEALEQLHTFFGDWHYFDEASLNHTPVNSIDPSFVTRLQMQDNWYYRPDGTKSLEVSPNTTSQLGFRAEFHNSNDFDELEATLLLNVGLYSGETGMQKVVNSIHLSFPEENLARFLTIDFAKKLLESVAKCWPATIAFVSLEESASEGKEIKWLTHIAKTDLPELNEEGIEVEVNEALQRSLIQLKGSPEELLTNKQEAGQRLNNFLGQNKLLPSTWYNEYTDQRIT